MIAQEVIIEFTLPWLRNALQTLADVTFIMFDIIMTSDTINPH